MGDGRGLHHAVVIGDINKQLLAFVVGEIGGKGMSEHAVHLALAETLFLGDEAVDLQSIELVDKGIDRREGDGITRGDVDLLRVLREAVDSCRQETLIT